MEMTGVLGRILDELDRHFDEARDPDR